MRGLLTFLTVVALLVGGGGWRWQSGQARILATGTTQVLVSARVSYGMDARVFGPLTALDGCLGIGDQVAVFPHGTELVESDPLTIEIPDLGRYSLGDPVEIGGGSASGPEVGEVELPAGCRGRVVLTHTD